MIDENDPDDAPELTEEASSRAQIAIGGKIIRKETGTYTKEETMTEETTGECPTTVEQEATAFQAVRQRAKDMGFAGVNDALDALAAIPRRLWGARDADEGNRD